MRAIVIGRSSARAGARHRLFSDLADRVRLRFGQPRVAQRVVLAEEMPRIRVRLVDRHRRHHQRRLRLPAVREQQAGALRVDAERPLEAVREIGGDLQQIREVPRQTGEVALGDVDGARRHTQRLHLVTSRRLAEAGDPPHLVVRREHLCETEGDPPRRSGDEDLLVPQHPGSF
jgi:hypothetical protein